MVEILLELEFEFEFDIPEELSGDGFYCFYYSGFF